MRTTAIARGSIVSRDQPKVYQGLRGFGIAVRRDGGPSGSVVRLSAACSNLRGAKRDGPGSVVEQ